MTPPAPPIYHCADPLFDARPFPLFPAPPDQLLCQITKITPLLPSFCLSSRYFSVSPVVYFSISPFLNFFIHFLFIFLFSFYPLSILPFFPFFSFSFVFFSFFRSFLLFLLFVHVFVLPFLHSFILIIFLSLFYSFLSFSIYF